MTELEKIALIKLRPEFLARLLNLPEGAHVDAVFSELQWHGCITLRIRGAGWPTPLGCALRYAVPTINSETGEIDLGLPKDDPTPHT